ncbi:MAG: hypothetical protein Q8N36_01070 [bacterium]|nr:hypothetical protein [bacterium]
MKTLIERFSQYINDSLGISARPQAWTHAESLPLYLLERYDFFHVTLLQVHCIVVINALNGEQTPAIIEKHFKQIATKTSDRLIYVRETMSSYDRKRFIERKVSFVVPGNQMYMPFLGLDLREYFFAVQKNNEQFSPSAQYLLLYLLQRKESLEINPTEAAALLGYSSMTMTRAFQELERSGIGEHEKRGKGKYLNLSGSKKAVWQAALPYLQTPVQRRIYIRGNVCLSQYPFIPAGQSALAQISMIAEPQTPTYAIQGKLWADRKFSFDEVPYPDINAIELELWSYPVFMLKGEASVDGLSLYLSMKECTDERVQGALNDMLERVIC